MEIRLYKFLVVGGTVTSDPALFYGVFDEVRYEGNIVEISTVCYTLEVDFILDGTLPNVEFWYIMTILGG